MIGIAAMPRAGGTPEPLGLDLPPCEDVSSRCSRRSDTPRTPRRDSPTPVSDSDGSASCRARHADGGTLFLSAFSGPSLSVEMFVDVPRDPRDASRSARLFRKMLKVVAGLQTLQNGWYEERKWVIHGERAAGATLRRFERLGFIGDFHRIFEDVSSLTAWWVYAVDSLFVAVDPDSDGLDEFAVKPPSQSARAVKGIWPGRKSYLKYKMLGPGPSAFAPGSSPSELGDLEENQLLTGHQPIIHDIPECSCASAPARNELPEAMIKDLIGAIKALHLHDGKHIFQFACGNGELLRRICTAVGCPGIGVDRDAVAVKKAQHLAEEAAMTNVEFRTSGMWETPDLSACFAVLAFMPRDVLFPLAEYQLAKAKMKKDTAVFVLDSECGDLLGLDKSFIYPSGLAYLLHVGGRPRRTPPPEPKVFTRIVEEETVASAREARKSRRTLHKLYSVVEEAHRKVKRKTLEKKRRSQLEDDS